MDEEPEKPPKKSEPILSDPTLFNNFWLNEIKSLDESIRILLSVNILLLSAYFTIIAANYEKITGIVSPKTYTTIFYLYIILFPPLISWVSSLKIIMENHGIPPLDAVPLLIKDSAQEYLKLYYTMKHARYRFSCLSLATPFSYFFIMSTIATAISSFFNLPLSQEFLMCLAYFAILYGAIIIVSDLFYNHTLLRLGPPAEEPEEQPSPLPPSEPELIIKADMAGAYYEYKTKAKKKGWWQFWR